MQKETELTDEELHLLDVILKNYKPAKDWESAEHVFSVVDFMLLMGLSEFSSHHHHRFMMILEGIDFYPVINENNRKYYYLLNAKISQ